MKWRVGLLVLVVALAGCSAPTSDPTTPTIASTTEGPTFSDSNTTTITPTTETTTVQDTTTSDPDSETLVKGVAGNIGNTSVEKAIVISAIELENRGTNESTVDIAVRFVENNSFAKIDRVTLNPGQQKTLTFFLPTYGDDPDDLTVQLRIEGDIVAERPVTS